MMPEFLRVLRRLARRPGLRPHLTDNIGYGTCDDIELRTIQGGFPRPWLGCRAGLDALGVTSDGRVKGCLALPDTCTEGNVREESPIAIWNDPERFRYNRHYSPAQLSGACADCEQAQRCRGGCTATAYAMHGRPGVSTHCFRLHGIDEPQV
jgi:radical SAM protein with 4Fe4S-binding SPASM domain